ncbi:MAG TPA: hypothetical protein VEL76_29720 [Gemmataceae bacterium]|nr:hypothetical protein [Gemmataceae bacterium]
MIHKKTAAKDLGRSGRSLASRLLGGAVRATLPAATPPEPWHNKQLKGKHRGKRP